MNQVLKRIVSICLTAALIFNVGSTALTAKAEETTTKTQTANGDWEIDENGDVIVNNEDMPTGELEIDINAIDDDHKINSLEEYKDFAGIKNQPASSLKRRSAKLTASLPDEVDNSTNGNGVYFPPIRSQGRIGSCVAWATTYYQYTNTINKARGVQTTTANTYSPMWTYNLCNNGEDEGTIGSWAYDVLLNMGAAIIEEVPIKTSISPASNYLSWHAEDEIWEHALHNRISDYTFFTTHYTVNGVDIESSYPVPMEGTPVTGPKDSDLDTLKTALNNGDVLAVSVCINSWKYKTIKNCNQPGIDNSHVGDIAAYVCDGFKGGHKMTLVGYNDNIWVDINNNDEIDDGEMGAFKIANSWGTGYGNKGFYWVAYDALNKESSVSGMENSDSRNGILHSASAISVENKDYASDIYLKYTLNSARRNDTIIGLIATEKNGTNSYTGKVDPYDIPFYLDFSDIDSATSYNGTVGAGDGTMYYDLNNLIPGITADKLNDYNWSISISDLDAGDVPLTVKELKFIEGSTEKEFDILKDRNISLDGTSTAMGFNDVELFKELTASIEITPKTNFGIAEIANVSVNVSGGTAPYQYKYEMQRYGQTSIISDWTSASAIDKQLYEIGPHYFNVTIKDAEGLTKKVSDYVTVNPTYIMELNADRSVARKGDTVRFTPVTNNLASVVNANDFYYTVTKNNVSTQYTANSDKSLTWTPTESGDYSITCDIIYNSQKLATKTVNYTVSDDSVTIYYKGYSTPYIHYQVGSGSWTNVPSVAMTPDTSVEGYTHSYTIALGSEQYANVCFNNGNNSWDSNNGFNYRFEGGYYKYSNGTFTKFTPVPEGLKTELTLSDNTIISGDTITLSASAQNGKAPYEYKFTYKYGNGSEATIRSFTSTDKTTFTTAQSGEYTFIAYVKDSTGATAIDEKTVEVKAPAIVSVNADKSSVQTGEGVRFSMNVNSAVDGITYKYTAANASSTQTLTTNSDNTADWTPVQKGSYTVTGQLVYKGRTIDSRSINYTVEEKTEKQAVIYYGGYTTPYIHYQVGSGSWTSVPGVAMTPDTSVEGCTHSYTIDLGNSDYANVCFNNGSGSWDSNNGSNYRFENGTYKYLNGTITKLENKFTIDLSVSAEAIILGESVHVNGTARNGKAPYSVLLQRVRNGGCYTLHYSPSIDSADVSVDIPLTSDGTNKFIYTVTDADGNKAVAEKSVEVKQPSIGAFSTSISNAHAGETVKLMLSVNESVPGLEYRYSVTKDGAAHTLSTGSDGTANWTPTEAGTYTLTAALIYNGRELASSSIDYTVEEPVSNSVTIYYRGYSTPYIHYQVGSGSWTNVPGVAMTATNELSGYTHKYTIDLMDSTYANVCFNDGHGSWDSRNGANYRFEKGTYTYSNGSIAVK